MPLTLKDLRSKVVELDIKVDDDPKAFSVRYRPHAVTAKTEEKVQEFSQRGAEISAIIEMFLPVVESWTLRMDMNEPVVPLTRESLEDFPGDILIMIMNQIMENQRPDPKETDQQSQ